MKFGLKEILAIVLAVVATVGIFGMLTAEQAVMPAHTAAEFVPVLHGLKEYSAAFGLLLVMVAISLMLLGWEEKLTTDPDRDE